MKYYTYNGVTTTELPKILRTPDGMISPISEQTFTDYGGVITEDEETLTPEQREFRDSDCCVQFRALVAEVQGKTGVDDFYGAYEDIPRLRQTEYAQQHPDEMSYYTSLFAALDGWCNKDAKKYGLGQPAWFYVCWNRQPPVNKE